MKLEAVTLFSLVAIVIYASPAAYPENQANAHYSSIDAPVIVHLEKRVTVWNKFLGIMEDIEDAIGHKRRVKERQRESKYQDYLKQRMKQKQQEEQDFQKFRERSDQEAEVRRKKEHQRLLDEDKIRQKKQAEHQKQREFLIQQEQEQEKEKEAQEYETQQEQKKENLRKQKQEEEDLKKKEQKEQQKSEVKYPKLRRLKDAMTEHLVCGKRPNFVEPSEKVLSQLGTTLWTARKAIQIGILVDTHPFSVDRCILCDQQLLSTSIAHLVVECEQVNGHRIQSGLAPAIQKSRLRLLGRSTHPGVENVYTWLRGGVLNGEADLDQRWLDGIVEHESMGTRHDNRALAARLADFLQVAYQAVSIHIVEIPPGSPCGSWLTDF
ncbi:hypothetical protein BASA50_009580 [Batrachochytrium salamandrivorans]|uniref:Reverse transcriptase zinc-binding domain-containing protein n=1 Tax=Batrachochytrium salamandrivorans TaxID=1357716 RepID=A0ABQ8F209_9FUNG|nr:hypothetical protein BASA50_009580 [Batrachochytrium salamandrivorans]